METRTSHTKLFSFVFLIISFVFAIVMLYSNSILFLAMLLGGFVFSLVGVYYAASNKQGLYILANGLVFLLLLTCLIVIIANII